MYYIIALSNCQYLISTFFNNQILSRNITVCSIFVLIKNITASPPLNRQKLTVMLIFIYKNIILTNSVPIPINCSLFIIHHLLLIKTSLLASLLSCYGHIRYENIGRTEARKACDNTAFKLISNGGDILQKFKEIACYGKALYVLALLAVTDHKACRLE